MKGNKLLKEVLKEISPDRPKVRKETDKAIKKLNSALKKHKINAKAVAGGSVAKGTFLKGDHDCDIFVKFNLAKYSNKDISKILGKIMNSTFNKVTKVHGSRDYYHIKNDLRYEIVPVLDVKKPEQALNVTDCSPLHVNWVNKFPKMKNEIMLTKAFCKAINVYGAESYIKGFSGHVVDILTINCGGFLKLLKAVSKWKHKKVIDYYNKHKGKALMNLNKSKTQSALIVIDPIQPDRNAAAALGDEKFDIFTKRAKEFLKSPSKSFFIPEKIDIEKIEKKANAKKGKLILIDVQAKAGKEDVVGAKLLKSLEFIVKQMKMNDFNVIDSGWDWNKAKKALLWIIVGKDNLEKTTIREGPPVKVKMHYEKFKKMHKKTFEKKGKVYAEIKREFVNAELFITHLAKDDYIKAKTKKVIVRGD
ncbi:CCA tRNA nucleotidyltransferase [candidate division KSB1 bacterium]